MASSGLGPGCEPTLWLPTCKVIVLLLARSARPGGPPCQRHKHIGHPTASPPRRHPRSSEPWLTTLPTPWAAAGPADHRDMSSPARQASPVEAAQVPFVMPQLYR